MKFSIILPVRNGGMHFRECVESILDQSRNDYNLIILDNNSSDDSIAWVESLSKPQIEIYPSESSLSITGNWSRITGVPKNEFITLIGHDDLLHPHYLEEMDKLIDKHPGASLYQAHYNFIDAGGKVTGPCKPMDEVQYGHEFLAAQMARTIDSMGTGYMMRSADYDALGGIPTDYPNLIFADYHLWVLLSLKSFKATTLKTCFSYRVHNSVSKVTNGEEYQQAFEKYIHFIAEQMKIHPEVRQVVERYGYDMLMFFCESLSHRILKTPVSRRKISVETYINKCREYASLLIPGVEFNPLHKPRIRLAKTFDSNAVLRSTFHFIKKMTVPFT